jgi:hypothetical protein
VLHMKQELVTLSEHLSAPQVFTGVPVTQSLVLYVCCADRCLSFCPFLLAIVLSHTDHSLFPQITNACVVFQLCNNKDKRLPTVPVHAMLLLYEILSACHHLEDVIQHQ